MKFAIAAIALSCSSLVAALYTVADLPACSVPCFTKAVMGTNCGVTDFKCQCTTGKAAITASVTPCLASACNSADLTKTVAVSDDICKAATGSSTSSGGSSSGTSSSSGTAAAASGSSTGSSSASPAVSTGAASWKKPAEIFGAGAAVVAAGMLAL